MSIPNFITEYLNEKNIMPNTIRNYTCYIKDYINGREWDDSYVYDLKKVNEYVSTISIKSREGFLTAITHVFDAVTQKNRQQLRDLTKQAIDESLMEKIKSLKENEEEKIEYEEMLKIGNITQKNKTNDLISKLYTLEVPFRADTWSRMRVCDVEESPISDEYNFINLETGVVYLNRYKTVRTYGKKQIQLNNDLLLYIKKWWNDNHGWLGNVQKFLVANRDGNILSPSNFNARLRSIFGFGSSVLRHSYISYMKKLGKTVKELQEVAKRMNTSYMQLNLTYDDTHSILKDDE